MKYFILTNNPLVQEKYGSTHDVRPVEGGLREVLICARDEIDEGAILLNHPLYGSVKPNETPYRSLLLQPIYHDDRFGCPPVDVESVRLIELALNTVDKFTVKKGSADAPTLEDYRVVDLSLLGTAVDAADR